ncbi:MAG: DUF4290 domain-containing protein [Bacteroidales bacterium]|nr:DUF4290 domain-containing protein [Bacteroidales bacterium]
MEYNTQRTPLIVPEYGRNVQKMVDYCLTIEDRQKRSEYAKRIVESMKQVNPNGKDSPNYEHKLWDHLFIISDYKLDVDAPYSKPRKEEKDEKPQPLKYKNSDIHFRTYGMFLEQMINKIASMQDGEEKKVLTERVTQELKKAHLQWNINTCDDDVILKHLEILSKGKLKVGEGFQFRTTKELLAKPAKQQKSQTKKKKNVVNNGNNKQK